MRKFISIELTKLALIFGLLTQLSHPAFSNDGPESQDCEGPDTSTHFEGCVLSHKADKLDAELNSAYQLVLSETTSPAARKALAEAEQAWIVYRDKTCKFEQEFFNGINSINLHRCNYRMMEERLAYLQNVL